MQIVSSEDVIHRSDAVKDSFASKETVDNFHSMETQTNHEKDHFDPKDNTVY